MDKKKDAYAETLHGNDIKTIRNQLGLTLKEFASLVHVSVKTIERWEAGDKEISGPIVSLVRILHADPALVEKLK